MNRSLIFGFFRGYFYLLYLCLALRDFPASAHTSLETVLWATRMGLTLSNDAVVKSVKEFSFAAVVSPACDGIHPGDRVQELNGRPVHSKREFENTAKQLANTDLQVWSLLVNRNGRLLLMEPPPGYRCDPAALLHCGPSLAQRHQKQACLDIDGIKIKN